MKRILPFLVLFSFVGAGQIPVPFLEPFARWLLDVEVYTVAISPAADFVAIGCANGTVLLKEHWKESCVLQAHTQAVWRMTFSPDGRLLATASEDGKVKLWEAQTCRELAVLSKHTNAVYGVAFSPDGKLLASCGADQTILIWDVENLSIRWALEGHTAPVFYVTFSPDGRFLASCGQDRTVRLWEVATGREFLCLSSNENEFATLDFSPDSRLLVAGGDNGEVRFWEIPSGEEIREERKEIDLYVFSVLFHPVHPKLVFAATSFGLYKWPLGEDWPLAPSVTQESILAMALDAQGRYLVLATADRAVHVLLIDILEI